MCQTHVKVLFFTNSTSKYRYFDVQLRELNCWHNNVYNSMVPCWVRAQTLFAMTNQLTYVRTYTMYQPIYFAKIVHKLTYLLVISWQELSMYYTFRAVLNSKVKQKWIGNKSFFKWRVRNPCLFATAGYCSHLHKSAPSRQANCARDTLFNNGPGQANVDTSFCIYGWNDHPTPLVHHPSFLDSQANASFINHWLLFFNHLINTIFFVLST